MQSRILGTTMPVLEFALDPNESVISEAGELSWMTSSIQMTTHTQFGGGGGIFGVLKRVAGGGSLFMTEYRAIGAPGAISFATKLPGHIVPIEVGAGHEYMIHRHGFLCATPQIQISVGFQQSLGAGIFGGVSTGAGGGVVSAAMTAMSEIIASSAKIAEIVSAIDQIAFQTNLLGVNAAIATGHWGIMVTGYFRPDTPPWRDDGQCEWVEKVNKTISTSV